MLDALLISRYAINLRAMDDNLRAAFLKDVESDLAKLSVERERLRQIDQRIATLQVLKSNLMALEGPAKEAPSISYLRETTFSVPVIVVSLPDAIKEILTAAPRPLHVKEIHRELQKRGHHMNAKEPLTAIVAAIRRRKDFVRTGPNTFGLHVGMAVGNK